MSLLKILLTNACIFECAYCINRRSSNVRRARFSVQEVVDLTLNFYRRNYIEGLFLSSGIIRSSAYTMELMVRVARSLPEEPGFTAYIHLKTIPDADPVLQLLRNPRIAQRPLQRLRADQPFGFAPRLFDGRRTRWRGTGSSAGGSTRTGRSATTRRGR